MMVYSTKTCIYYSLTLLLFQILIVTPSVPYSPNLSEIRPDGGVIQAQDEIDPLVFSTYYDSPESMPPLFSYAEMYDYGRAITRDDSGSIYIAGEIGESFLSKISPSGNRVLLYNNVWESGVEVSAIAIDSEGDILVAFNNYGYITVAKMASNGFYEKFNVPIAGSAYDIVTDIAIDTNDNIYIVGYTSSNDFPLVNQLFEKNIGQDAFLTVIDPSGQNILFSTLIGGSFHDIATSIALDSEDNVYIGGYTLSDDFPVINAFDTTHGQDEDGFILKINSGLSDLLYSSYIGGSGSDLINSIYVTDINKVSACGLTSSPNYPQVGGFGDEINGEDAFIFQMDISTSSLSFSTSLGGSDSDEAVDLSIDEIGQIYVTGETKSADFPTLFTHVSNSTSGLRSIFVSKISTSKTLQFSTIVGGTSTNYVHGMVVDDYGSSFIIGESRSADFPTRSPLYAENQGYTDVILFKLADLTDSDGDTLSDYRESLYESSRYKIDTDDDSMPDNYEVQYDLDPLTDDTMLDLDEDGLSNLIEFNIGTLCDSPDSDMDSYSDWFEYTFGFNPLDPTVTPLEVILGSPLLIPSIFGLVVVVVSSYVLLRYRRIRTQAESDARLKIEAKEALDKLREVNSKDEVSV